MAVVMAFSASAQRLVNANDLKLNRTGSFLKALPSQTVIAADKYYHSPFAESLKLKGGKRGLNRVSLKAEEDNGLFYVRPEATFELCYNLETYYGVSDHVLAPAFAPLTWTNRSDESVGATTWYYIDMNSEEVQESTDKNLVMTPKATDVGYSNYMPLLAAGEDLEYSDSLTMKYGGDATILFADNSTEKYPLSVIDVWQDVCWLDSYNVGTNCVNYAGNYDNLWTQELQEIYESDAENISNARLMGLVQYIGAPASPYIINNIQWQIYWKSSLKSFDLTLKIIKADENGEYTQVIGESKIPCAMHSDFSGGLLKFPLKTKVGKLTLDGVVVDGPVILEVTGFHDEGMDATVTNFLSPMVMMYYPEMVKRQQVNAGAHVSFDYNNEGEIKRLETYEKIAGAYWYSSEDRPAGYPWNEDVDSLVYTHSYPIFMDVEYPFIYSKDSKIELPAEGGNKKVLVAANNVSELWDVTDEEGNFDLPEWISIDFVDTYVEDSDDFYNDTTNVTFTVDALPEGVEGREAKILISYPFFENPAVVKEFRIVQGKVEDEPAEHSELYLVGGFNDWDVAEDGGRLVFAETEEGVYETKGAFLADSTEFKIITPDPNATDPAAKGYKWFGGLDENNVGYFLITDELLEQPLDMINGSNFRLPKAGYYFFTVKQKPANDQLQSVTEPLVLEVRFLYGDVNCDGSVNAADVTALYGYILNGITTYEATSDVNGDGSINAADVTAVYKVILGSE